MTECREAVLLVAFNRPDLLAEVIERVRAVRPPRVYLAVDGPRADRPGEAARVAECQTLAGSLDWGCEVHTLFRESNLGCGRGVSGAVTWFFENEERGIILEDDILPEETFFAFASELLDRYENDDRVGVISGTNFVPPQEQADPSGYRFTRVPIVWGWASWRRVWQDYRFDIDGWRERLPSSRARQAMGGTLPAQILWSGNFDMMARHVIDTWDLQLVCACMTAGRLSVAPPVNLVENVGFRPDATHTVRMPGYLRPTEPIPLPTSPIPVAFDEKADAWMMRHVYEASFPGLARQGSRYLRRRLGI